jgi:hypothetical protein
MRKGLENGRPLCNEKNDAVIKMPTNKKAEEHLQSRKWQTVNGEIAYKTIINCTNTLQIRNKGGCL